MKKLTCALLALLSATANADVTPNPELNQITAFQANSATLLTSGLPTEAQFQALAQAGVDVVINLMPDTSQGAHQDEGALVRGAGMNYVYLPIDWDNPTRAELDRFFALMAQHADQDILLHCKLNYRASAFAYLYQLQQGKEVNMAEVMAPWGDELPQYPKWQALIDDYRASRD